MTGDIEHLPEEQYTGAQCSQKRVLGATLPFAPFSACGCPLASTAVDLPTWKNKPSFQQSSITTSDLKLDNKYTYSSLRDHRCIKCRDCVLQRSSPMSSVTVGTPVTDSAVNTETLLS